MQTDPTGDETPVVDRLRWLEARLPLRACLVARGSRDMPRYAGCSAAPRLLLAISPGGRVALPQPTGARRVDLPPGAACVVPGGSWNWPLPCDGVDYLHLGTSNVGLKAKAWTMGRRGAIARLGVLAVRPRVPEAIARLWAGIEALAGADGTDASIADIATALVREYTRAFAGPAATDYSPTANRFGELVDHVCSHLRTDHDRRSLAERFAMHPNHVSRLFRRHTGKSFKAWLTGERLALARRLLEDPDLSIAEVAWHCGYRDQAYFANVFRRQHGTSPSGWRRDRVKALDRR